MHYVQPGWSSAFSVASELFSLRSSSRWENKDVSLCFLWSFSISCLYKSKSDTKKQSKSLTHSSTHSFTHSLRQIDYILTSSESNPLLGLWSLWSSEAAWELHQVSFMFLVEASWFWYQTHKLASCSDEEAPSLAWKSSPRHSWSTYDMAWSKLN